MPKKTPARIFTGTSKKRGSFEVSTTLTNAEAITALRANLSEFASDCADHIELMAMSEERGRNFPFRPNLVAWGFKLASEPPRVLRVLKDDFLRVVCRRPAVGIGGGEPFKVTCSGSASKYEGQYTITDGGEYPRNAFYGRTDIHGRWKPTNATPQALIDHLSDVYEAPETE